MPPVVSLIGKPNCGKTTLLENLIPMLIRRGYRVGTVKHHVHTFTMDTPGKDTWRHKRAGARAVILSAPAGLAVIRDTDRDTPLEELINRYFHDVDLVITEGYKKATAPKIEVFNSAVHREPLAATDDLLATVSDIPLPRRRLPRFKPDDIKGLTAFLIDKIIRPSTVDKTAVLMVNGDVMPLSTVATDLLRQTIAGLLDSLQVTTDDRPLDITISTHALTRNDE